MILKRCEVCTSLYLRLYINFIAVKNFQNVVVCLIFRSILFSNDSNQLFDIDFFLHEMIQKVFSSLNL